MRNALISHSSVYHINMKNSKALYWNLYFTQIPLPPPLFLTYISVLFVGVVAVDTEKNESEKVKRRRDVETHSDQTRGYGDELCP